MLESRRNLVLACALSGLAGYVDGIGYLHLGGLFVSFMSGNSTRLGVSLSEAQWDHALEAVVLIVLFVAGAAAGSLIVLGRVAHRQPLILLAEAVLLTVAAAANEFGVPNIAVAAVVVAMGLENSIFQLDGGGGLGLTYVTGALVRAGQLIAAALTGGAGWAWLPNLLLWAALVAGTLLGALAYRWINLAAIWFAAGTAFALGMLAAQTAKRTD
ncbi:MULTISPECIES: YoaK family protein [unclassified Bradyrhizobium]|uniref:YoaK family protein n=1 Tax=unclassified Bradyrhizobium TaxID=2631580 RepID=UPI0024795805|nr:MULTISPECIES: YoaK family protein [unclassified Bradyrhizobium]WGS20105.1 YoaK family protein [Bradyrhizobium sp. ISRA463]WGS26964.1 YoaK family protein [Bradyrhizobium sp. ISRA464]